MERAEVLQLLRKRLDDDAEVTFTSGAVLDSWRAGGAIGVRWPSGERRTFGPRELDRAYDYALGRS